jgi:hypothetical protein
MSRANQQHRSRDHSPWLWMSKPGLERAASAGGEAGVAIYCALCKLESNAPPEVKGDFFASAQNIATAAGVGVRTAERYLPILAKAGLFTMRSGKRSAAAGKIQANRFTLLDVGLPSARAAELPSANESRVNGGHKRYSARRAERKSAKHAEGVGADAPRHGAEEEETSGWHY